MKKIYYSTLLILTALAVCGFRVGSESLEDITAKKKASKRDVAVDGPVVVYTETVIPEKTPQQLYKQYHLLAVSSLEESVSALDDNKQWAFRMAHNAYKYIKLIQALIVPEKQQEFDILMCDLQPLLDKLKKRNVSSVQQLEIARGIEQISQILDNDFAWEEVKQWIKE